MLNIHLEYGAAKCSNIILPEQFTREILIDKLTSRLGFNIDQFYFMIDRELLQLDNLTKFNQQKSLIRNNSTMFALRRLLGGERKYATLLAQMFMAIEEKLPQEMKGFSYTTKICAVCLEQCNCLHLCCSSICQICFMKYFKSNHWQLKCLLAECQLNRLSYNTFFRSSQFIEILTDLQRKRELLHYIDVQFCTCGQMLISETLLAQHRCSQCARTFCFFCNKTWDSSRGMSNNMYTCKNSCEYESKITFQLTPMCAKYNAKLMLPNRRCCPKCFTLGAYGDGCKFHVCTMCKYTFCFICLESEGKCRELFKTTKYDPYAQKCTEIKQVGYEIFPRYVKP